MILIYGCKFYLHLFTGRTSHGWRLGAGPMLLLGTGSSLLFHHHLALLQNFQHGKMMMGTLKPHSTLRTSFLMMLETMVVIYMKAMVVIYLKSTAVKVENGLTSPSLSLSKKTKLNQKKKLPGRHIQ